MNLIGYHKLGKDDTELINTLQDNLSGYLDKNQMNFATMVFLILKRTIQEESAEYMIPIKRSKNLLSQSKRERELGISYCENPMFYTYVSFLHDAYQSLALPDSHSVSSDDLNNYLSNFRR